MHWELLIGILLIAPGLAPYSVLKKNPYLRHSSGKNTVSKSRRKVAYNESVGQSVNQNAFYDVAYQSETHVISSYTHILLTHLLATI